MEAPPGPWRIETRRYQSSVVPRHTRNRRDLCTDRRLTCGAKQPRAPGQSRFQRTRTMHMVNPSLPVVLYAPPGASPHAPSSLESQGRVIIASFRPALSPQHQINPYLPGQSRPRARQRVPFDPLFFPLVTRLWHRRTLPVTIEPPRVVGAKRPSGSTLPSLSPPTCAGTNLQTRSFFQPSRTRRPNPSLARSPGVVSEVNHIRHRYWVPLFRPRKIVFFLHKWARSGCMP